MNPEVGTTLTLGTMFKDMGAATPDADVPKLGLLPDRSDFPDVAALLNPSPEGSGGFSDDFSDSSDVDSSSHTDHTRVWSDEDHTEEEISKALEAGLAALGVGLIGKVLGNVKVPETVITVAKVGDNLNLVASVKNIR